MCFIGSNEFLLSANLAVMPERTRVHTLKKLFPFSLPFLFFASLFLFLPNLLLFLLQFLSRLLNHFILRRIHAQTDVLSVHLVNSIESLCGIREFKILFHLSFIKRICFNVSFLAVFFPPLIVGLHNIYFDSDIPCSLTDFIQISNSSFRLKKCLLRDNIFPVFEFIHNILNVHLLRIIKTQKSGGIRNRSIFPITGVFICSLLKVINIGFY